MLAGRFEAFTNPRPGRILDLGLPVDEGENDEEENDAVEEDDEGLVVSDPPSSFTFTGCLLGETQLSVNASSVRSTCVFWYTGSKVACVKDVKKIIPW